LNRRNVQGGGEEGLDRSIKELARVGWAAPSVAFQRWDSAVTIAVSPFDYCSTVGLALLPHSARDQGSIPGTVGFALLPHSARDQGSIPCTVGFALLPHSARDQGSIPGLWVTVCVEFAHSPRVSVRGFPPGAPVSSHSPKDGGLAVLNSPSV